MRTLARRLAVVLAIPLLLVLTSCIRMTMDLDIDSVDRIDISADFGMQNSAAAQLGSEMPDFCSEMDFGEDVGEGGELERYSDDDPDGYTGCRISGTATLEEMNDGGDTTLTFADDVWTFTMDGADAGGGEQLSANMFTDFHVSVTFPGEVLTHNGTSTVSGTTVTWDNPADLFTSEGLHATASNTGGGLGWLWILLGVLALAAIGAAIYFATRRKKGPAGPSEGQPYPPQDGPGSSAYQPEPQQYPQPGAQPHQPGAQPHQPGGQPHQPGFQPPQQGFQQPGGPQQPPAGPQQPPQGFQQQPPTDPNRGL